MSFGFLSNTRQVLAYMLISCKYWPSGCSPNSLRLPSLPSSFPLFRPPSLGSLPETHQLPKANSEIVSARYHLRPSPVPSYTHQGIVGSVQLLRVGGTSVPLDSSRPEGRQHRSYRFTCSANNCSDIPLLNRDKGLRECLIREVPLIIARVLRAEHLSIFPSGMLYLCEGLSTFKKKKKIHALWRRNILRTSNVVSLAIPYAHRGRLNAVPAPFGKNNPLLELVRTP